MDLTTNIQESEKIPFPNTKLESWKYTDLKRFNISQSTDLKQTDFEASSVLQDAQISTMIKSKLAQLDFILDSDVVLVFYNGTFRQNLSKNLEQQASIQIIKIGDFLTQVNSEEKKLYFSNFGLQNKLNLQNNGRAEEGSAYFSELSKNQESAGIYIKVSKDNSSRVVIYNYSEENHDLSQPIQSNYCSIQVEKNASISVLEIFNYGEIQKNSSNFLSHIHCEAGSSVKHLICYPGNTNSKQLHSIKVNQSQNSEYQQLVVAASGKLLRQMQHLQMHGEHAKCDLNGIFIGSEQEHLDFHSQIEHLKPNCWSRQIVKGILSGTSRGIFDGKIIFHKDAQKSITEQGNYNILLSDHAEIDSKPQLEIDADDVTASHGSTVGQLDQEALFYLQSRGLSENVASRLLLKSFVMEFLDIIEQEELKAYLSTYLEQQFEAAWLNAS